MVKGDQQMMIDLRAKVIKDKTEMSRIEHLHLLPDCYIGIFLHKNSTIWSIHIYVKIAWAMN